MHVYIIQLLICLKASAITPDTVEDPYVPSIQPSVQRYGAYRVHRMNIERSNSRISDPFNFLTQQQHIALNSQLTELKNSRNVESRIVIIDV